MLGVRDNGRRSDPKPLARPPSSYSSDTHRQQGQVTPDRLTTPALAPRSVATYLFAIRPRRVSDLKAALRGTRYSLTPTTDGKQMLTLLGTTDAPTPYELELARRLVRKVELVRRRLSNVAYLDVSEQDWDHLEVADHDEWWFEFATDYCVHGATYANFHCPSGKTYTLVNPRFPKAPWFIHRWVETKNWVPRPPLVVPEMGGAWGRTEPSANNDAKGPTAS